PGKCISQGINPLFYSQTMVLTLCRHRVRRQRASRLDEPPGAAKVRLASGTHAGRSNSRDEAMPGTAQRRTTRRTRGSQEGARVSPFLSLAGTRQNI
ncbi:hypothetical protein, partial [Acerihabitans sp.]|uniref:hypothetical protein n=1 Tax=Acerihabitans sp. TaxID=2811394 RepID=UPI002EDA0220